jgi:hypothetical protein
MPLCGDPGTQLLMKQFSPSGRSFLDETIFDRSGLEIIQVAHYLACKGF